MKPHIFHFQNIAYFQACGSYSLVVEDTGKIKVVARTIKHYEERLKSLGWCRIHQTYMVNPLFIKNINFDKTEVLIQNGKYLPISRRKRTSVKNWVRSQIS
jgi:two-component system, LytTR family, response regulator